MNLPRVSASFVDPFGQDTFINNSRTVHHRGAAGPQTQPKRSSAIFSPGRTYDSRVFCLCGSLAVMEIDPI